MMPDDPIEARRAIAEKAALWLMTLQSESLSSGQRTEFVDWLRESPLHIAEILRICQMERDLSRLKFWRTMPPVNLAEPAQVVQLLTGQLYRQPFARPRGARRRLRAGLLMAASVAALSVFALLAISRLDRIEHRTQAGERRELTLADGSVVELEPASDLLVQFRAHERLVTLNYGEAVFRVMHDPTRPFIVEAAQTRVRAVGTIFNVERDQSGVSITVVEGRVAVSQQASTELKGSAAQPLPVLNLEADEGVSISPGGATSAVRRIGAVTHAGSAADELEFRNETVSEVVRRFNLRNSLKIEVLDDRLAARRVSGIFKATDPQSFVQFIQAVADARVERSDSTHIVLQSSAIKSNDAGR